MSEVVIHRFGRFALDLERRELRAGRDRIPLQPRVFELLRYFAENPARAISRDELLAEVWAGVRVTDGSLTKAVRVLRAVLGRDPALREAVETVRGHGYRFSADIETEDVQERFATPGAVRARPFVGRAGELAKLAELASQVRRGGRRFVLIVGAAGSGKSALAQHAVEAAAADFLVGEGQCIERFGEQTPYLPIAEALLNFARSDPDPHRARIRSILQRAAPSWRAQLPALFPENDFELDPIELQPAQIARQILDALEMIGMQQPTALVLEDIQWADHSTLGLLHSLARRTTPSKLLTICTVTTPELAWSEALRALRADVSRMSDGLVIESVPIAVDAVRQYALWSFDRDTVQPTGSSDRFVDWLHGSSGGNPLYFTQLIDHLASLGLLEDASRDETFSASRLEAAGIPSTLGQLIRHWVTRLEPNERAILEAASAAGFAFDLRVVQAALGADEVALEASCDRLCAAGWLRFREFEAWGDGSRGARLRFEHVLFREALYQDIPPNRRARLHHAIARRIEAGHPGEPALASQLAVHYELAGSFEESARHRIAAAVFAASSQSVDETLHHAEVGLRSLAALPAASRRGSEIDLQISIGMGQAARRGFSDELAIEAFERALALARDAGDVDREVAATWGIASCRKMQGELEAAREAGSRLLALAETIHEPRHLRLALDLLCSIAFFQGRFDDCVALKHRADRAIGNESADALPARLLEDVRVHSQLYGAISEWHRGHESTALDWARDAVARAERLRHPYTSVFADCFTSILYFLVGDETGRCRHALRAHRLSEQHGIALWGEIARFIASCAEPPSADALPVLRDAFGKMARHGGLGGTFFIGLLANRELAGGQREAAAKICRAGIELAERTTELHHLPMLYLTDACLARDPSERSARLAEAEACARRTGSVALQARVARARETDPMETSLM